jgi:20S proteasome alpha/beta subunit
MYSTNLPNISESTKMHPARDYGFNQFSADGSLEQVNYASKAAEANNTVVGVVGKSCVVLITKSAPVSPLIVNHEKSTYPHCCCFCWCKW